MNITATRLGQGRNTNTCRAVPAGEKEVFMNRFKYQAYLQEFPFLHKILGEDVDPRGIDKMTIKRADENLLSYTPHSSSHVGSMGRTKSETKVHFVLMNGEILENAVIQEEQYSSNYSGDTPFNNEGESILEAIDRCEIDNNIAYIVVERYYIDDWSGREREEEYTIEIYKTPKNTTYTEIVQKAQEKALAEVRAEANF